MTTLNTKYLQLNEQQSKGTCPLLQQKKNELDTATLTCSHRLLVITHILLTGSTYAHERIYLFCFCPRVNTHFSGLPFSSNFCVNIC